MTVSGGAGPNNSSETAGAPTPPDGGRDCVCGHRAAVHASDGSCWPWTRDCDCMAYRPLAVLPMTSPTGPDRDRLRASDAGQETEDQRIVLALIDEDPGLRLGVLNERTPLPVHRQSRAFVHLMAQKVIDLDGAQRVTRIPAPQQPPAQEREHWCSNCEGIDPATCINTPPSEAHSAGEGTPIPFDAHAPHYDELRDRQCPGVTRYQVGDLDAPCGTCGGRTGWLAAAVDQRNHLDAAIARLPRPLVEFAEGRAASSGVRGGDDQARERLADVLALHQSLGAQNVWCGYDGEHWPCVTVRAAGGDR